MTTRSCPSAWTDFMEAVKEGLAYNEIPAYLAAAELGVSSTTLSLWLTRGTLPVWAVFPLANMAGVAVAVLLAEQKFGGLSPRATQDGVEVRQAWAEAAMKPLPVPEPEPEPEPAPEMIRHYDEAGRLHRDGGPAVEDAARQYEAWYVRGRLHRLDGPASTTHDTEEWYFAGKHHRDGGPAITTPRKRVWKIHGKLHRLDGPAVEHLRDGRTVAKEYWIGGQQVSADQFSALQSRAMWLGLERVKERDAIKKGGW